MYTVGAYVTEQNGGSAAGRSKSQTRFWCTLGALSISLSSLWHTQALCFFLRSFWSSRVLSIHILSFCRTWILQRWGGHGIVS